MTRRGDSNLAGFWDAKDGNPITFIPRSAKVFDSKLDELKPSVLIVGELKERCRLIDSDGKEIGGEVGSTIGVWGKAGMRDIIDCKGVVTFMQYEGEKDIGRAKPMKMFGVYSESVGELLIPQDRRKNSRRTPHFLESELAIRMGNEPKPPTSGYDDDNDSSVPLDSNGKPLF
jgi:hypothetical protein